MIVQVLATGDGDGAARAAAERLAGLVQEWGGQAEITQAPSQTREDAKVVDPFSVAALVLAIPGAVLAAVDLADRITKRHRARQLIDTATQLEDTHAVEVLVIHSHTRHRLADLNPDRLLELTADDPP